MKVSELERYSIENRTPDIDDYMRLDIAVQPDHQGRGLGKAIMTAIMEYVNTTLPVTAYVSLIADVPANRLYEQCGFKETAPRSVGMSYLVR